MRRDCSNISMQSSSINLSSSSVGRVPVDHKDLCSYAQFLAASKLLESSAGLCVSASRFAVHEGNSRFFQVNANADVLSVTPFDGDALPFFDLSAVHARFDKLSALNLHPAHPASPRVVIIYSQLYWFHTVRDLSISSCDFVRSSSKWPYQLRSLKLINCLLKQFDTLDAPSSTIIIRNCTGMGPLLTLAGCRNLTRLDLSHCEKITSITGLNAGLLYLAVSGLDITSVCLPASLVGFTASGCRYLESLAITHCSDINVVDVSLCPLISSLDFQGLDWLSCIDVSGCIGLLSLTLIGCTGLLVGSNCSIESGVKMAGCINLRNIVGP